MEGRSILAGGGALVGAAVALYTAANLLLSPHGAPPQQLAVPVRLDRPEPSKQPSISEQLELNLLGDIPGRNPIMLDRVFKPIDEQLQKLPKGHIAYNAPAELGLNQTADIRLVLSLSRPPKDLRMSITAGGVKRTANIRVSQIMAAQLRGQDFEISPAGWQEQAVSGFEDTVWAWDVKPTARGTQVLHLEMRAFLAVGGEPTPRSIGVYDAAIVVNVSIWKRASDWVGDNYQWVWVAILLPLAGLVWRVRKDHKKPKPHAPQTLFSGGTQTEPPKATTQGAASKGKGSDSDES